VARLTHYNEEKLKQFSIDNQAQADDVFKKLKAEADGHLLVRKIEKKQRKRQPSAPFITSTLQQEAIRKLGFTAQRTMRIAQQLYEGIDIGEGAAGLITYMRTDSVTLAKEAVDDIRQYIAESYGKKKSAITSQAIQKQIEECTGSPRGGSANLCFQNAKGFENTSHQRAIQTL